MSENYFAEFRPELKSALARDVSVRPAGMEDLEGLVELAHERDGEGREYHRGHFEKELRENEGWVHRLLLVASAGDGLAGFGRAVWFSHPADAPANTAPEGWYLGGVVVSPGWRRRGIGAQLTSERLRWIGQRSDTAFYFVNAQNLASIALHEKFGFREVTRDFFMPGASFAGGVGILFRADLQV